MGDLDWHRGPDRTPLFDVMVAMEVGDDTALFTATRARGLAEGLCGVLAAMAEERKVAEILDRGRPVATA